MSLVETWSVWSWLPGDEEQVILLWSERENIWSHSYTPLYLWPETLSAFFSATPDTALFPQTVQGNYPQEKRGGSDSVRLQAVQFFSDLQPQLSIHLFERVVVKQYFYLFISETGRSQKEKALVWEVTVLVQSFSVCFLSTKSATFANGITMWHHSHAMCLQDTQVFLSLPISCGTSGLSGSWWCCLQKHMEDETRQHVGPLFVWFDSLFLGQTVHLKTWQQRTTRVNAMCDC